MKWAWKVAASAIGLGVLGGFGWLALFLYDRGLDQADKLGSALGLLVGLLSLLLTVTGLALSWVALTRTARPGAPDRQEASSVEEPTRAAPKPAQLPADMSTFVGRADELSWLDQRLDQVVGPEPRSTGLAIAVVSGPPGVGKTALAVHWAHRVRASFPDGQLYVDLRGYDPDQPVSAHEALVGFLQALGLSGQDVPLGVAERVAAYRSLVSGRRLLVILDNANEVEQLRSLLPGSATCFVVVTSRSSLVGLVVRHGAARLELDVLPPDDSVALLRELVGGRADDEPGAARRLAEQCSHLPLALRLIAERLSARTADKLVQVTRELTDERSRLRAMSAGGDSRTAIPAVFSWSLRNVRPEAARAFCLLGLHPGADFDVRAGAALAGVEVSQGQDLLDELTAAHLLNEKPGGRYTMHDLLKAFAKSRAELEDEPNGHGALNRLFDYYLAAAGAAVDVLQPAERDRRPTPAASAWTPPIHGSAGALNWLDAERATLVSITGYLAEHGWPGQAIKLSSILFRYLDVGGHFPDAVVIHGCALAAAQHAADLAGQADALTGLGAVYFRQCQYSPAQEYFHQALALYVQIGDRPRQTALLGNLGLVAYWRGAYGDSTEYQRRAQAAAVEIDDRIGQTRALNNLGILAERLGHYGQAVQHYQEAASLSEQIGDQLGQAHAIGGLGSAYRRLGRTDDAFQCLRRARALLEQVGDRTGLAGVLGYLGEIEHQLNRHDQAIGHYLEALDILRIFGDPATEAWVTNRLGQAVLASGQSAQAHTHFTRALTLAGQGSDQYETARAHSGLAQVHQACGRFEQARRAYGEALAIYTELQLPEAAEIRAHLATLPDGD